MNLLKQMLVDNLSDRHLLILRGVKRWIMRQPPVAGDSAFSTSLPFDVAGSIPPSVFQRRPVKDYRTAQGTFYLPVDSTRDPEAIAIRSGKILEPGILRVAEKYVARGTVVLEIGAGFGQLSVLLSSLVGEKGQVLAFEADEYVFDTLVRNVRANHLGNIRAFLGAAYDRSRTEVFFPKRVSSYRSRRIADEDAGGSPVHALAIDRLDIQAPVSFMHVHAPGRELHALRGAAETIKRFQMPIAIELDAVPESGGAPADLLAMLSSLNYRIDSRVGASGFLALPERGIPAASVASSAGLSPEVARPDVRIDRAPFQSSLCKLLRHREDVEECTRFLKHNGFVSHSLLCKDWDLAHLVSEIGDGNFLDMGSSDSYILMNLSLKRIDGELHGIDLRQPDVPVKGVRYSVGDLMNTGLPGGHFSNIACLSVLEHQVDYSRFAAEVSRLLVPGGRLFVTFDYWEPKLRPPIKLYGLEWQPLDSKAVHQFTAACMAAGLRLSQDFDWTLGEPVIQWGYYSPHPEVSYTFGMASFRKS